MTVISGKEREVREGDVITDRVTGHLGPGKVTRVTAKYIWIKYTLQPGGEPFIIKRQRDIFLMGTKYY